jgi:N-formylglutamate deformylase
MTTLFHRVPARTPVLINVPHAGRWLPAPLAQRMTPLARRLPDTDWHVDTLYQFATALGCGLLVATHTRYVIDLNRDPTGLALYPGSSNSELCPLLTFAEQPIYLPGQAPSPDEVHARIEQFHAPYHAQLAADLDQIIARHGHALLLDAHSIASHVPRFFTGRLPDLNLGTADNQSCSPAVAHAAWHVLSTAPGFTSIHNGRFKGGYITRHYGRPATHQHALQLELSQSSYLSEETPEDFSADRAAPLLAVLNALVQTLLQQEREP